MKLLLCHYCSRKGAGGFAVGPASERFPEGEPLVIGRAPDPGYVYRCHRCNYAMELTSKQYNALVELKPERIKELGF